MEFDIATTDYDFLTKLRLVEVADRLLAHTPFDKLSVSAICTEAAVSRSTFYRHFDDKYALVNWLWSTSASRCFAVGENDFDWYLNNLQMMEFSKQFPALFTAALAASNDYNSCINYGYRQRVSYLENYIQKRDPALLTEDIRFQIHFFVKSESEAIGKWMRNGFKESPEKLAHQIVQCVPNELKTLVDRLS